MNHLFLQSVECFVESSKSGASFKMFPKPTHYLDFVSKRTCFPKLRYLFLNLFSLKCFFLFARTLKVYFYGEIKFCIFPIILNGSGNGV